MPRQGQWVNGPKEYNGPKTLPDGEPRFPRSGLPTNGLWKARYREDVIQQMEQLIDRTKWESSGTTQDYPTRKLALRALEDSLSTINSSPTGRGPLPRLADFANRWDATVLSQHKPSTQRSTQSQLRRWILPKLGNMSSLRDLDGQRLQAFIADCDCNPKTVSNLMATLRMMWNSARAWTYVANNPFTGLVLPKSGLAQTFALSLEETKRIIELGQRTAQDVLLNPG